MKKSELSVVIFMLGFCAFFFYETLQLPPAAQSYPKFVIGLLAVLTLMQLVKMACSCPAKTVLHILGCIDSFLHPDDLHRILSFRHHLSIIHDALLPYRKEIHGHHRPGPDGPDLCGLQRIFGRASAGWPLG